MDLIDKIKKNFVTSMNNPIKISHTFYSTVEEVEIGDKVILYIFIPESLQVHRCSGKIYDRNKDGYLYIIDNTNLVTKLYMRKLALNQKLNNPWNSIENLELLKNAGLY